MNNIHRSQLFAILMLSGAWSVLCLPRAHSGAQLLGIAAAFLVQLFLSIPMLVLAREGFSFSNTVVRQKWLGILYVLFFLLWGAHGFTQFRNAAAEINLPVSGSLTAVILITLTCLYTCSLGLKAMARSAPAVLALLLMSIAVLIIGAAGRVDITRLAPQSEGFWRDGFFYLCIGGELTAALVLLDRTKSGRMAALWGFLAGKALLACLIIFLCICAAGRLSGLSGYPFFTLTALSQPLQSQRADALYILIFVMLYIMHITLQTGVISHLLRMMFPKFKVSAPFSLGVMILLSWALPLSDAISTPLFGLLILATAFVIPALILLIRRFHHEKNVSAPPAAPPSSDGMRDGAYQ
ncbi:MAG: hypothetical protein IKK51_06470 [Oscillospiraceae bacterium]|nr:hypothetical protein [Oscillospiraceae bacterium]MBR4101503.1 hypothetical protein [Oscillospiraceae bacterium]